MDILHDIDIFDFHFESTGHNEAGETGFAPDSQILLDAIASNGTVSQDGFEAEFSIMEHPIVSQMKVSIRH